MPSNNGARFYPPADARRIEEMKQQATEQAREFSGLRRFNQIARHVGSGDGSNRI
jgi:hypothetical protein